MTIILFLAVLFVLVLVHEWGHFFVAKKAKMQVDEFGIGLPPKIYGKKIGETEYTLNALPIGGFVRILGENAEDIAVGGGEGVSDRSFVSKSRLWQAAVLVAGVTMNVIFAWVLLVVVFSVGVPTAVDENEATPAAKLTVTQVLPNAPAGLAEIPAGATISAVGIADIEYTDITPSEFSKLVENQEGNDVSITYKVAGEDKTAVLVPKKGLIVTDMDRPAVGIGLSMVEKVREPIYKSLYTATITTGNLLVSITVGLGQLVGSAFLGEADLSQIAGPVGIAGMVGDAAEVGFTSLLLFTAIISLNLAVINLLPFPALDGGRLLMVGVEAVSGRNINPKFVGVINLAGFALLIILMLLVTYNDILRIF